MPAVVEDDIRWLKELHEKLWAPAEKPLTFASPVAVQAQRRVTQGDLERAFECIEKHELVTEMFSSNMFGGYGMSVYAPPIFLEVPLERIFWIVEENLPTPTRYDYINGTVKDRPKKTPGSGRDDAWEMFSKYTHSEKNQAWLKRFKLAPSRERSYYDY